MTAIFTFYLYTFSKASVSQSCFSFTSVLIDKFSFKTDRMAENLRSKFYLRVAVDFFDGLFLGFSEKSFIMFHFLQLHVHWAPREAPTFQLNHTPIV